MAAGLSIQRVTPRSVIGESMSTWLHLMPDELVWIVRPVPGSRVPERLASATATPLVRTLDGLLGELLDMRGRLRAARREIRRLEADGSGGDPGVGRAPGR